MLGMDYAITTGLQKSEFAEYKDWNLLMNGEINADIIVNGSSKARVQVSPSILDSILDMNTYNLGIDGHDYYLQHYKYLIYRKRNVQPKVIIQVVSNGTFSKRKDLYGIDQFLPYIDNKLVQEVTSKYEGFTAADFQLPYFRYLGKYYIQFIGLANYLDLDPAYRKDNKYKGFISHDKQWDKSFDSFVIENPEGVNIEISAESLKLFKSYVKKARGDGSLLFLVYPPTYKEAQGLFNNRNSLLETYQRIAERNDLIFLDYSNFFVSGNKDYFYNSQHLNKRGAEIFSRKLSLDIKYELQKLRKSDK